MASLKEQLKNDLTTAMRERDDVRKSTLRMVLTSVRNEEVSGAEARELSDDDVISVLTREAKRRREAAQAFRDGGREGSAAQEDAEAAVIAEYLPTELTDAEIAQLIEDAVAEADATSMRDMGMVMKILQPKVRGRADGAKVAAAVKARLSAG